jgi:hypothetical protein
VLVRFQALFDPIDNLKLPNNHTMIESPNFLLTKEHYKEFNNQKKSIKNIFIFMMLY